MDKIFNSFIFGFVLTFLCVGNIYAVDEKLTDQAADTAVQGADLIYIVDDVAGTPTSKKITATNFFASPATGAIVTTGALNSGSITSGFGAIDNGSSNITTTGTITGTSAVTGSTTLASRAHV